MRVLIIEARFYNHIADGLLTGAKAHLESMKLAYDIITVPGIFELPAALKLAMNEIYQGYIVLGTAIRGESDHYHFICGECMRGVNEMAMTYGLALGNGVLTVHNEAQALVRSSPADKNLGGQAARACTAMMALKSRLTQASGRL